MRRLRNWLDAAQVRLLEPRREQRITQLADHLDKELGRRRQEFDVDAALDGLMFDRRDLTPATEHAYTKAVERAWRDERVSERERQALDFVYRAYGLSKRRARELERKVGLEVFGRRFAEAMEDGVLSDEEHSHLDAIAGNLGLSFGDLARTYFRDEGERFLRGMFAAMAEDGEITREEWSRLMDTTERLGVPRDSLIGSIRQPAQRFVESVLADAKTDGRLDAQERATLEWLLDNVLPDGSFHDYVAGEVDRMARLTAVEDGQLPSLDPPSGLALRAGEIVHWCGPVLYQREKQLKSGPKLIEAQGRGVITDSRLILDSSERAFDLNHRRVIAIEQLRHGPVEVRCSGKGQGRYSFHQDDAELAAAVWRTAVGRSNQTITQVTDGVPSRHIPRDVRQRVWQRYGGRCAECGDDQYLEFDHVIPIAKGGSSTDNNVQLLCRRCNLSKSDSI